jgi:NhaA family Na+:H+ antiporter
VAFGILPVFAFFNAGVSLQGVSLSTLLQAVPMGIALGLVLGKTVGILGSIALMVSLGWAQRPSGANWTQCLGMALLCGIGFTMSLFIGMLAFEDSGAGEAIVTDQLGVLSGSLLSAVIGYVVLNFVLPRPRSSDP